MWDNRRLIGGCLYSLVLARGPFLKGFPSLMGSGIYVLFPCISVRLSNLSNAMSPTNMSITASKIEKTKVRGKMWRGNGCWRRTEVEHQVPWVESTLVSFPSRNLRGPSIITSELEFWHEPQTRQKKTSLKLISFISQNFEAGKTPERSVPRDEAWLAKLPWVASRGPLKTDIPEQQTSFDWGRNYLIGNYSWRILENFFCFLKLKLR